MASYAERTVGAFIVPRQHSNDLRLALREHGWLKSGGTNVTGFVDPAVPTDCALAALHGSADCALAMQVRF